MSDAYPFTGTSAGTGYRETLKVPLELDYDFDKNDFRYDSNGQHIIVSGNDALKIWIYKALMTERFRYLAYSWQYGLEVRPYIGKVMGVQERYSEMKRIIIECLMVNPYIKSIDRIDFTAEREKLTVDIGLTTIYGEVSVNV
nr:MAG TPA: Protein of unknown function (DUF2634) [Caudoviricetes sp.]